MKRKIAVVMGGYSHEAQISLKSGETVMASIDKNKFATTAIVINEEGWNAILEGKKYPVDKNDFSILVEGKKQNFDAVFMVIHGTPGEDGKLQAYFDLVGIPYSTSGVLASSLTFNKYACNAYLKQMGIRCASSVLIRQGETPDSHAIVEQLGLPVFVKPSDGGSSFGVTKVKSEGEIEAAVSLALQHGTEALIESFVKGTEVTCGIIGTKDQTTVLPATEIVSKNEFFDFDAKYKGDSEEITPARISPELMKEIQDTTRKVFKMLGLRGLSRIDYIIMDNVPYLIEVNTVPGLSAQSIIPQQAKCAGISLPELFNRLLDDTLSSH
jgi:D-alanine-D-alanine ligase